MERKDKTNYYLDIAEAVAERSTCLRRGFGVVIVKNDEIISTGYNGSPRGRINCSELGYCMRDKLKVPRGERYELCRSVHGEQNAIISAARKDIIGATLYIVGIEQKERPVIEYVKDARPCAMCKRVIINSGIEKIVVRNTKDEYTEILVQEYIDKDDSLDGSLGY